MPKLIVHFGYEADPRTIVIAASDDDRHRLADWLEHINAPALIPACVEQLREAA